MISYHTGKTIRLGRIFEARTQRAVMVAVDHGQGGAVAGIAHLLDDLTTLVSGQPDAMILGPGALRRTAPLFQGRGRPGVIVAVDYAGTTTLPGRESRGEAHRLLTTAEDALRLGADALKTVLVFGRERLDVHADNVEHVARLAHECERWGLPLLIEPVLWGKTVTASDRSSPEILGHITRIAVELGADVVKVAYTGSPDTFRPLVEACPVPLVILGGARMNTERDVLATAAGAMQAGAAGLAFGRNVFQHPDPVRLLGSLRRIVHGEQSVEEVLRSEEARALAALPSPAPSPAMALQTGPEPEEEAPSTEEKTQQKEDGRE